MRFGDMETKHRFQPVKTLVAVVSTVAAIAATVGSAGQAAAQNLCMPRDEIVELLDARYSEAPIALGLASGGRLVEVFSTADGATWTLLLTAPDGTSCMMAEGQGWSALPGPIVGQVS